MTSGTPQTPGSDPACWAHLLCPECGAVPEDREAEACWQCGAVLPPGGAAEGLADEGAAGAEEG